ncbi:MAG: polymer-forming cytoskeletal protein [Erysipelotrichaceae bacterium]|nr:polymer-forming cytoskeletal protein [Erysipelotrichaceae bacterium]
MINLLDYTNINTTVINEKSHLTGDMHVKSSLDLAGHIDGNLQVDGLLRINGKVTGNVEAMDVLMLRESQIEGDVEAYSQIQQDSESIITGNVFAESADMAGLVEGSITVNGALHLRQGALIKGDVSARSFWFEPGVRIEGRMKTTFSPVI